MKKQAKVRKRPESEDRGPFLSDAVVENWLRSYQCWVCHDLACASLRGMSKVFDSLSGRLQSVPERFVSRSVVTRNIPGVDLVLFLRHATESQPLEVG